MQTDHVKLFQINLTRITSEMSEASLQVTTKIKTRIHFQYFNEVLASSFVTLSVHPLETQSCVRLNKGNTDSRTTTVGLVNLQLLASGTLIEEFRTKDRLAHAGKK